MYASPRSDFDVSAPPEYTEADYQRETAHPYWQQRATKEAIQVRDYANTFDFLEGKFPRPGKLLDIGSGYGELITEFNRRGWETVGIDPHPVLCRWTKERGLNVINGFFESSGFAESEFDVVTMNHVIEHVLDPLHLLKGIHHVLKPNGYAIVETPRYDSVPFKLLGRRERSLSCNGHIYFFTGPTLTKLAELAGFSGESAGLGRPYDDGGTSAVERRRHVQEPGRPHGCGSLLAGGEVGSDKTKAIHGGYAARVFAKGTRIRVAVKGVLRAT